jgi:hypothetical protein
VPLMMVQELLGLKLDSPDIQNHSVMTRYAENIFHHK